MKKLEIEKITRRTKITSLHFKRLGYFSKKREYLVNSIRESRMFPSCGEKKSINSVPMPWFSIKPVGFFLLLLQLIASLNQKNCLLSFYISESINLHLAESFLQLSESKYKRKKQILLQTLIFLKLLSCFLSLGTTRTSLVGCGI